MIIALVITGLVALGEAFILLVAFVTDTQVEQELLAVETDNEALRRENYQLKQQCQKLETRLTMIARN